MARRGRKRKFGARKPCGRLATAQPQDKGPDEVRARRGGLNGETDNPLPGLVAQGIITETQAEAGELFAATCRRLFGETLAKAARYQEYIPGEPTAEWDEAARTHAYYAAKRAIRKHMTIHEAMRAEMAVRITCIEWKGIRPSRIGPLRNGLDALAAHYGLTRLRKYA